MNIVKVSHKPNGLGRRSTQVGIPLNILRDLPEGVTHMTCQLTRWDGAVAIVYRPIINFSTNGKKENA